VIILGALAAGFVAFTCLTRAGVWQERAYKIRRELEKN